MCGPFRKVGASEMRLVHKGADACSACEQVEDLESSPDLSSPCEMRMVPELRNQLN